MRRSEVGQFGQGRVSVVSDDARYIARLDELAMSRLQQRLAVLMAQRHLSARRLAATSRVSVNTVRLMIHGQGMPSLGKVLALAHALGVNLDALFGESPVEALVAAASAEARDHGSPEQGILLINAAG